MSAATFICPQCQRVLRTLEPLAAGRKVCCPVGNTVFAPVLPSQVPGWASPIRRAPEPPYSRLPAPEDEARPPLRRRPYEAEENPYARRSAARDFEEYGREDWDDG